MRGFSLIELLVALTVIVLASAFALPRIGASVGVELDAAARVIAASLRQARSDAVTRGKAVVVTVDLSAKRIGYAERGRMRALPAKLHYRVFSARSEQTSGAVAGVRFFPDGTSTGGRITARAKREGGAERLVDVDWLTGRVRVLDPEKAT